MSPQRLVVLLLAVGALVLIGVVLVAPRLKPTRMLSGYIEGEPLYLAAPVSGQVTALDVERGDRVVAGEALFEIDTRTLAAARAQAQGEVGQARAAIAAAQSSVAQLTQSAAALRANAAQADREAQRARRIFGAGDGAISQQDEERAASAALAARADAAAAERQSDAGRARVVEAQGQLAQAQGALADADARLAQAAPRAPAAARVEDTFFQKGEWAAANQPILALLPDDRVRLRFFVPERDVARYHIGAQVRFSCDGCAGGLSAKVNYVSPRPEFTPPVIYSLQSRDRLVFLVEALPANPRGLAPGLPVDVVPLAP